MVFVIYRINYPSIFHRGFEVDFKSHGLKKESKKYERVNPCDLVKDFDW